MQTCVQLIAITNHPSSHGPKNIHHAKASPSQTTFKETKARPQHPLWPLPRVLSQSSGRGGHHINGGVVDVVFAELVNEYHVPIGTAYNVGMRVEEKSVGGTLTVGTVEASRQLSQGALWATGYAWRRRRRRWPK